ncbi:hypothetical protein [Leucobacter chironomi]|uniref:DUF7882 family protein n=1 Tax=Leucobacter chironomi TaxID=491918 RepID=UPI0003FC01C1|nr:hypothetical protein [Leucobacter chironomi]
MGTLIYGRHQEYRFDDRTLEHLRVVIVARVRRNESFFLTWTAEAQQRAVTTTLWISAGVPIVFHFSAPERPPLSRAWLQRLTQSSYSSRGLVLTPEHEADPRSR